MECVVQPPLPPLPAYAADIKNPNASLTEYTRGMMSPTHKSSIAGRSGAWFISSLLLVLVPLAGLALPLALFGKRIFGPHINTIQLSFAIVLLYIELLVAIFSAILFLFPNFFAYHRISSAVCPPRRHRSHWSFMSLRRLRRLIRVDSYSILLRGTQGGTASFVVDSTTTVGQLKQQLIARHHVPDDCWAYRRAVLIKPGRRLPLCSWETMAEIGVGAGAHLELRFLCIGGDPGEFLQLSSAFKC
ncbi:uncharacterized protein SCHCODRAFT_02101143 [Schizophyllum commune H4-8]|uniref:uncharacterized protein n=1 Tax=Schizophyllum commune (strain H4-8 / FGSC 9210) TaxID=578458 RepID=UPI0021600556|nr:uncharacterized protein SCHCODRAFT_02101143 [Schizophyllum commune H4-8]KAI5886568.1 hypothetical protein SCHCODRAFT_02101143 [Schizophyllum commune H4-8]